MRQDKPETYWFVSGKMHIFVHQQLHTPHEFSHVDALEVVSTTTLACSHTAEHFFTVGKNAESTVGGGGGKSFLSVCFAPQTVGNDVCLQRSCAFFLVGLVSDEHDENLVSPEDGVR